MKLCKLLTLVVIDGASGLLDQEELQYLLLVCGGLVLVPAFELGQSIDLFTDGL